MTSAGTGDTGSFNRLRYDNCAFQKTTYESTGPLKYQLFEGAHEHCNKYTYDENSFYRPFDLVDEESELWGITRAATKCPQFQYNPNCKNSKTCKSTFDKKVPIVMAQEVRPIVHNNLPKVTSPGYTVPTPSFCGRVTVDRLNVSSKGQLEGLQRGVYASF
jgi:hypothetical protein